MRHLQNRNAFERFCKIKLIKKCLYEINSRYFCLIIHLYIRNIKEKGHSEILLIFFLSKFTNVQLRYLTAPLPPTLQHPDCLSKFWCGVLLKSWNNSWICACIIVKRIVFKNLFFYANNQSFV